MALITSDSAGVADQAGLARLVARHLVGLGGGKQAAAKEEREAVEAVVLENMTVKELRR